MNMYSGRWTAGRVIAAVIVWTLLSNVAWLVIVTILSLAAVARFDWDAAGDHGLWGLYACLSTIAVVLICRTLYYRTAEGRGQEATRERTHAA